MNERQSAYEVILNESDLSVTIHSINGLNDRAMRDMARIQWFAINRGFVLSRLGNDHSNYTTAIAKYLPEEFVGVRRYFDYCNQGITITIK
jgi:hypothetical protein